MGKDHPLPAPWNHCKIIRIARSSTDDHVAICIQGSSFQALVVVDRLHQSSNNELEHFVEELTNKGNVIPLKNMLVGEFRQPIIGLHLWKAAGYRQLLAVDNQGHVFIWRYSKQLLWKMVATFSLLQDDSYTLFSAAAFEETTFTLLWAVHASSSVSTMRSGPVSVPESVGGIRVYTCHVILPQIPSDVEVATGLEKINTPLPSHTYFVGPSILFAVDECRRGEVVFSSSARARGQAGVWVATKETAGDLTESVMVYFYDTLRSVLLSAGTPIVGLQTAEVRFRVDTGDEAHNTLLLEVAANDARNRRAFVLRATESALIICTGSGSIREARPLTTGRDESTESHAQTAVNLPLSGRCVVSEPYLRSLLAIDNGGTKVAALEAAADGGVASSPTSGESSSSSARRVNAVVGRQCAPDGTAATLSDRSEWIDGIDLVDLRPPRMHSFRLCKGSSHQDDAGVLEPFRLIHIAALTKRLSLSGDQVRCRARDELEWILRHLLWRLRHDPDAAYEVVMGLAALDDSLGQVDVSDVVAVVSTETTCRKQVLLSLAVAVCHSLTAAGHADTRPLQDTLLQLLLAARQPLRAASLLAEWGRRTDLARLAARLWASAAFLCGKGEEPYLLSYAYPYPHPRASPDTSATPSGRPTPRPATMSAQRRPLPIAESIPTVESWALPSASPDSQDVVCLLKVAARDDGDCGVAQTDTPAPVATGTYGSVKSKARAWGKVSDGTVSSRELSKQLSDAMMATEDTDRWSLPVRLRLVEASLVQEVLDNLSL
jgi:hypothetical protein